MKILVTIFCLTLSSASFSQSEPFKGANTITIKTSLTADETYKKLGQRLIEVGFVLETSNADFKQIKTNGIATTKYNLLYRVVANVKDSVIIVRPEWRLNSLQFPAWDRWFYAPGKGTTLYAVYSDLVKVISPLGRVEYSKE